MTAPPTSRHLLLLIPLMASTLSAQGVGDPRGAATVEPMPTPRTLVFARGDTSITVDGSLQDWPLLPVLRLDDARQLSGTAYGAYRGQPDINASAFVMWDREILYFAAQVMDDHHLALTADTPQRIEIPPTDAIVLTFDPRRDTRGFGADPGRSEDVSFWLGDSDDTNRSVIRWDRLRGTARIAKGARVMVSRDEERRVTTYEAQLPWAEILPSDLEPDVGVTLGMQLVVDDYDIPLDPMPSTRIGWTFGTGERIDPAMFGAIRLSDRRAVDDREQELELPDFPAPPEVAAIPALGRPYWVEMHSRLRGLPPAVVTEATVDPESAGGVERGAWLAEYEAHVAAFPRTDFLRYHMCANRRMVRECAGMIEGGLPYFWDFGLTRTMRDAERDSPERGFRLLRVPTGGWLVRSATASFLIDPAGFTTEKHMWRWCDFALFTAPNDLTKRSDQLLMRMGHSKPPKKPFLHILQPLPLLSDNEIEVVTPGESYDFAGLKITVLGSVDERGWVTQGVGYHVRWPDGSTLVVSGREALEEQVPGDKPDVLLLSAQHPHAVPFAHRVAARLTVLDDVLRCASLPGDDGRVTLAEAYTLQRRLRPHSSMLMAPGEQVNSPVD